MLTYNLNQERAMKFLRMMLLACAIVSCHSGVRKSAKLQPAKTTNKSAGHPKQKKNQASTA